MKHLSVLLLVSVSLISAQTLNLETNGNVVFSVDSTGEMFAACGGGTLVQLCRFLVDSSSTAGQPLPESRIALSHSGNDVLSIAEGRLLGCASSVDICPSVAHMSPRFDTIGEVAYEFGELVVDLSGNVFGCGGRPLCPTVHSVAAHLSTDTLLTSSSWDPVDDALWVRDRAGTYPVPTQLASIDRETNVFVASRRGTYYVSVSAHLQYLPQKINGYFRFGISVNGAGSNAAQLGEGLVGDETLMITATPFLEVGDTLQVIYDNNAPEDLSLIADGTRFSIHYVGEDVPSFMASRLTAQEVVPEGPVSFDKFTSPGQHNTGNHFDELSFSAPYDGLYLAHCTLYFDGLNLTDQITSVAINGVQLSSLQMRIERPLSNLYTTMSSAGVIFLNARDNVTCVQTGRADGDIDNDSYFGVTWIASATSDSRLQRTELKNNVVTEFPKVYSPSTVSITSDFSTSSPSYFLNNHGQTGSRDWRWGAGLYLVWFQTYIRYTDVCPIEVSIGLNGVETASNFFSMFCENGRRVQVNTLLHLRSNDDLEVFVSYNSRAGRMEPGGFSVIALDVEDWSLGSDCGSQSECVGACVDGVCTDTTTGYCDSDQNSDCALDSACLMDSSTLGTCITMTSANACDNDGDCAELYHCVGSNCMSSCETSPFVNGCSCTDNPDCESGVCAAGTCSNPSGVWGVCDSNEDCADYGISSILAHCLAGKCRECATTNREEGCPCASDTDCAMQCVENVCSEPSPIDGPCDTSDDCAQGAKGANCVDSVCLAPDEWIRIQRATGVRDIYPQYWDTGYEVESDFVLACDTWSASSSTDRIVAVAMGQVVDYYTPANGATVCEMLKSNNKHLWSNTPAGPFIAPDYITWPWMLGSALSWPLNNVAGDARQTISAIGNTDGSGPGGGRDTDYGGSSNAWGQAFNLYVLPADDLSLFCPPVYVNPSSFATACNNGTYTRSSDGELSVEIGGVYAERLLGLSMKGSVSNNDIDQNGDALFKVHLDASRTFASQLIEAPMCRFANSFTANFDLVFSDSAGVPQVAQQGCPFGGEDTLCGEFRPYNGWFKDITPVGNGFYNLVIAKRSTVVPATFTLTEWCLFYEPLSSTTA